MKTIGLVLVVLILMTAFAVAQQQPDGALFSNVPTTTQASSAQPRPPQRVIVPRPQPAHDDHTVPAAIQQQSQGEIPLPAESLPTSPEAIAVLKTLNDDLATAQTVRNEIATAAKASYETTANAARDKAATALTSLLRPLADAANFDEGKRVQDTIAALKAGHTVAAPQAPIVPGQTDNVQTRATFTAFMHQTRWQHNKDKWLLSFNATDMSAYASYHKETGTWAVVAPNALRMSVFKNRCDSMIMTISPDGQTLTGSDGGTIFTRVK